MILEMVIKNKDIQIATEYLEIEVEIGTDYNIEKITVDRQDPSEIEDIIIRDNMEEIQEQVLQSNHGDPKDDN